MGAALASIAIVPDREVAAQLARLRNANADLERRIRSDPGLPDSEQYFRAQIDDWRDQVQALLQGYPFQQRAVFSPIEPPGDTSGPGWTAEALHELRELRVRVEATIERLS